jgi:hypothetical protein
MGCRFALLLLLALPVSGEVFYAEATYRTEAEAPAVSDAGVIAFVSNDDLAPQLGVASRCVPGALYLPGGHPRGNADGSDEIFLFQPGALWPFVQLTDDPAGSTKSHVAIGRDGRAVAWVEERASDAGTTSRLYLFPLGLRQPVLVAESSGSFSVTSVSDRLPHGYRVATTEEREGSMRAHVVDVYFDRSPRPSGFASQRIVAREVLAGQDPSLSRDGTRLTYAAWDASGRSQVRLRGPGGEERAITAGDADSARPRLSGDGRRVAFESRANLAVLNRDGNREIFLYDDASRRVIQITRTEPGVENRSPRVNQDGTRVAFRSNGNLVGRNADGSEELFLWIDGSPPRLRQVTDTRPESIADPGPAPYPIGRRLAPVHHEQIVDRLVGKDGVLIQVGVGREHLLTALAVDKWLAALQPAAVVDHRDHVARTVAGVGDAAVPEADVADQGASLLHGTAHRGRHPTPLLLHLL